MDTIRICQLHFRAFGPAGVTSRRTGHKLEHGEALPVRSVTLRPTTHAAVCAGDGGFGREPVPNFGPRGVAAARE